MLQELKARDQFAPNVALSLPENDAFKSLELKLGTLGLDSELSGVVDVPTKTISFEPLAGQASKSREDTNRHPPTFRDTSSTLFSLLSATVPREGTHQAGSRETNISFRS